jgi:hypothetical protein
MRTFASLTPASRFDPFRTLSTLPRVAVLSLRLVAMKRAKYQGIGLPPRPLGPPSCTRSARPGFTLKEAERRVKYWSGSLPVRLFAGAEELHCGRSRGVPDDAGDAELGLPSDCGGNVADRNRSLAKFGDRRNLWSSLLEQNLAIEAEIGEKRQAGTPDSARSAAD